MKKRQKPRIWGSEILKFIKYQVDSGATVIIPPGFYRLK